MERILTLHKLPVIMLHPVLFQSICQAAQAVICPFILVHIFVRLIHQVIEAFSAGLTPVSYTHLDVYKRQVSIQPDAA